MEATEAPNKGESRREEAQFGRPSDGAWPLRDRDTLPIPDNANSKCAARAAPMARGYFPTRGAPIMLITRGARPKVPTVPPRPTPLRPAAASALSLERRPR
jgi:hypothetical protein